MKNTLTKNKNTPVLVYANEQTYPSYIHTVGLRTLCAHTLCGHFIRSLLAKIDEVVTVWYIRLIFILSNVSQVFPSGEMYNAKTPHKGGWKHDPWLTVTPGEARLSRPAGKFILSITILQLTASECGNFFISSCFSLCHWVNRNDGLLGFLFHTFFSPFCYFVHT